MLHRVFSETPFFGFSIIPSLQADDILVVGEVDYIYPGDNVVRISAGPIPPVAGKD